jgi:hypothetical protein
MNYLPRHRHDVEVEIRQEGNHHGETYSPGDIYLYDIDKILSSLAYTYGIIKKWLEEAPSVDYDNLFEEYENFLLDM